RGRRLDSVGFRKLTLTYPSEEDANRERRVLLWYPTTEPDQPFNYHGQQGFATPDAPVAPGRHPLILFSHGYLGAADQTIFLMEAFARDGYVVAAVNHADAGNQPHTQPMAAPDFGDPKSWTASKFRDRRDDLARPARSLAGARRPRRLLPPPSHRPGNRRRRRPLARRLHRPGYGRWLAV